MDIIGLIVAVLMLCPMYFVLRYNLHMFQLNGYKNPEHRTWLKKNIKKQGILLLTAGIGMLALFVPHPAVWLTELLLTVPVLCYYRYLKRTNTKKKLVYTNRVKRQLLTVAVLLGLTAVLTVLLGGSRRLPGSMAVFLSAESVLLLPVNRLNRPIELLINRHYVEDAKRRLAAADGLTVIGVTGSYGKTSVKYYLQTLLQERFSVLITPESYNTPMGVVKTIRESLRPGHEIFICEMGARHVGDIREICEIVHPKIGVITSIGPQHLETFFNMENIIHTKFELAEALPEGALLFLNGDNDAIVGNSTKYRNKVFYRTEQNGEGYYASDIRLSQAGTEFTVHAPDGETERFQMKLVGAHNVINVMGAIAVANRLGIPLQKLRIPVRRLQPVAHRLQLLEQGAVTVIDDAYNSNPAGSRAAVETLKLFEGVRILVTPGMVELGEKEEEYNYRFGTYAAACCDYILLVGKRHTEPIGRGALEAGFPAERCQAFDTLEEAFRAACQIKEERHKFILLENDLPDNY